MFKAKDKAKIIYINGLDNPDADYKEKLNQLKKAYGKGIAPIQVPIMDHQKMIGYVNVAKMEGRIFKGEHTEPFPIPEEMMEEVMPVKEMIDEAVANTNDDLLEKYLNEEPFTKMRNFLGFKTRCYESNFNSGFMWNKSNRYSNLT